MGNPYPAAAPEPDSCRCMESGSLYLSGPVAGIPSIAKWFANEGTAMTDLNQQVAVINCGLDSFRDGLHSIGVPVAQVNWRPPASGDEEMISILSRLLGPEIEEANSKAVHAMRESRPVWVDVEKAIDVIPGMEPNYILHSGPPIEFESMCDPQQRAVEGAAVFEGWVSSREELVGRIERGDIILKSNYLLGAAGAMCGIISPSMSVIVVENRTLGNRSWTTFNEGKGNVIWMGTYDDGTIKRLRWISDVMAPALKAALQQMPEGMDIFKIVAEGVQMGDEVHARSAACTMMMQRLLTPAMLEAGIDTRTVLDIHRFIADNNHFFLSFTIAACKTATEAAHGTPNSTVVTGMSRNGIDFGLRIASMDEWFITPTAPMDEAIYYSGYTWEDAAGDIGDSAAVEAAGLGGMIIGAAPSLSSFVGGSMNHSRNAMSAMRSICAGENPRFSPATVDFAPAPLGIDVRKVVRTGVTPIADTGVLHKSSGVGQIGTGIARCPLDAFKMALRAIGRMMTA